MTNEETGRELAQRLAQERLQDLAGDYARWRQISPLEAAEELRELLTGPVDPVTMVGDEEGVLEVRVGDRVVKNAEVHDRLAGKLPPADSDEAGRRGD